MANFTLYTPSEQVASHLRAEIIAGRWRGTMPGAPTLAVELAVDSKTVWAALNLLENEGLLISQGTGRRRRISLPPETTPPALRVAILDYDPLEQTEDWSKSMQQQLAEQGHSSFFAEKSLTELGMDLGRIIRLVGQTRADAWIICSGSREILTWFAQQTPPAFALFGRRRELSIAGVGPDHNSAGRAAVRRLLELGHQRIVILVRDSARAGGPGQAERVILEEMAAQGLSIGTYNLPDWKNTPKDFHRVLKELFRVTPPTALIIDEPFLFHAAKDHLAQRGILAPKHVSLICTDPDPTFAWSIPTIAHIKWRTPPIVRRVVRWTNNIARGKNDRRQSFTKAEFIEGGTVGKPPGER
ncbi:substrate-binding domain-containing protein [Akkermansiaceae bacterium]|nr:substrate-binding domain-containing protein [Akkermansiaceae bacterium]MDB4433028.1 substrate-binding domain-containing protein [Akkermansiaceae bacterium]MDB4499612.1 substrate-binding domain-containing protein [Akkermansiaceae bacterium]MDB4702332.1 substrate-binding domain-containing protein [Akkermansiaceae bacterium]